MNWAFYRGTRPSPKKAYRMMADFGYGAWTVRRTSLVVVVVLSPIEIGCGLGLLQGHYTWPRAQGFLSQHTSSFGSCRPRWPGQGNQFAVLAHGPAQFTPLVPDLKKHTK